MVKRALCLGLGGHISNQNATFKRLTERLESKGFEVYGARNGFEAFDTGDYYQLKAKDIPENKAGFIAGAGRYTLKDEDDKTDWEKIRKAEDFIRKGKIDILVGSSGDDHSKQMAILSESLGVDVYVLNKTMDNDLGGIDGNDGAPFTDFTNGFHTAVSTAVKMIHYHFLGSWTNEVPYLVGNFGRYTNWVGAALAYWGLGRIIPGELGKNESYPIDQIHDMILEEQVKNEKKYGRRFAMIIVPEGTKIRDIDHVSEGLIDPEGHHKLNPEVLVSEIKKALKLAYGMGTQTVGITYEMRNHPPTRKDIEFGKMSADIIADRILANEGDSGVASVFKIEGNLVRADLASISSVAETRYVRYYEEANRKSVIDFDNFCVTDEIGRYYEPLFGPRKRLEDIVPKDMKKSNVFV